MITTILDFTADISKGLAKTRLAPWLVAGDKQAHTFRVTVLDNGSAANMAGAGCAAYVVRADGVTVPVLGSVSGNVASVTLPASCYTVPGRVAVIIRLSTNSEINTIFYGDGAVLRSTTDTIVDPGGLIPSIDELLAQIAAMEAATKAANIATTNAQAQAQAAATAASNAQTKADEASSAAEEAANAAAFFDVLEASATALPPGSAPTAAWEDTDGKKKLLLGIPRGEKGETGSIDNLTINGKDASDGDITLTAAAIPVAAPYDTLDVYTALTRRDRVYNLLDNSDFTAPVNQRGQSTYTANGYTIDRWSIWAGALAVADGYVSVKEAYQVLELDLSKTYTLAARTAEGIVAVSGVFGQGGLEASLGNLKIKMATINGKAEVVLTNNDGHDIGGVIWAALYEGAYTADTLPAYLPKGYAAELLECQRYYLRLSQGAGQPLAFGGTYGTGNGRMKIPTPVAMRIAPTITVGKGVDNLRVICDGTQYVGTGIGSVQAKADGVLCQVTATELPSAHAATLMFATEDVLELNAEL